MKIKTVGDLHKYVGKLVVVTLKSGRTEEGKLGYTKEFSAKYDYRKPGYFTVNNTDFKLSHIKDLREK